MADRAVVCNECGKELTLADRFCAQCGSPVEQSAKVQAAGKPVTCSVCGLSNTHNGAYCEACGAKLTGRSGAPPSGKKISNVGSGKGEKGKPRPQRSKLEPWHYGVAAAVFIIAGYFIYSEVSREVPTTAGKQQTVPMLLPGLQQTSPPGKDILDAIARLEGTVKANPNDAGARLLLANALHDAGTHDPNYFPKAVDAYKLYLKQNPGDPNARVDLGICFFEIGKLDSARSGSLFSQAIEEMEYAIKKNPSHQAGAFNLGIVYLYMGNIQLSNRWFTKAAQLNPESDLGKRAKAILEQHNQAG